MKQELIWDYYQNEQPEAFSGSRSRLLFIARNLRAKERVLNVGVGTGIFEELATRRGVDVYSLDPSERSIAALRQRMGLAGKAKVGYVQQIPFESGLFDAVIISEVIEHLTAELTQAALHEIWRVLASRGRIIGTVPAGENLDDQSVVCPDCGKRFHRWGHVQSFDSNSIRVLLSRYFQIKEIIERHFAPWNILNWKGKVTASVKLALNKMGIHGSGEWLYFCAIKR